MLQLVWVEVTRFLAVCAAKFTTFFVVDRFARICIAITVVMIGTCLGKAIVALAVTVAVGTVAVGTVDVGTVAVDCYNLYHRQQQ